METRLALVARVSNAQLPFLVMKVGNIGTRCQQKTSRLSR